MGTGTTHRYSPFSFGESDERYYRRRASEEMAAAARAITPRARARHEELARSFISRVEEQERLMATAEQRLKAVT